MSIIAVGGPKGGSGKSTTSINLAVLMLHKNIDVLLLDCELRKRGHGYTTQWAFMRDHLQVQPRVHSMSKYGENLNLELRHLAKKYTDIIVDNAGYDTPEFIACLVVADLVIFPVRTNDPDIKSLVEFEEMFNNARMYNPNLKGLVFLNQVPTNDGYAQLRKAQDFLQTHYRDSKFLISSTPVFSRKAFATSLEEGKGVIELTGKEYDASAVSEITKIYEEAMNYGI